MQCLPIFNNSDFKTGAETVIFFDSITTSAAAIVPPPAVAVLEVSVDVSDAADATIGAAVKTSIWALLALETSFSTAVEE